MIVTVRKERSNQLNYVPNFVFAGLAGNPLIFLFFLTVDRVARVNRFHPA